MKKRLCTLLKENWLMIAIAILSITINIDAATASAYNRYDYTFHGAPSTDTSLTLFDQLQTITDSLIDVAGYVSAIMIAVTGAMWMFGNGNASNMVRLTLGVSLATNIAWFVNSGTMFNIANFTGTAPSFPDPNQIAIDLNTAWNFPGVFMTYFERVIIYAAYMIMPYALKILGFLTVIEMVTTLMFKLNGDHIHYLMHSILKTGFFIFLIINWINGSTSLANSLFTFFENLGIIASNFNGNVVPVGIGDDNSGAKLVAENIMGNAALIIGKAFGEGGESSSVVGAVANTVSSGGLSIVSWFFYKLTALVIFVVMFLTVGELVLTRLEFWTVALIAVILIPFGASQYTRFLFERCIGAVFNLGIKMCMVSFICYVSQPLLQGLVKGISEDKSGAENIVVMIACLGGCWTIYLLAKKVPQIVTGLLNGSPSLARGDILTPAQDAYGRYQQTAYAIGSTAGTIRAANNQAGGYNDVVSAAEANGEGRLGLKSMLAKSKGILGTTRNLASYYAMQTEGAKAWSTSQENFRGTKQTWATNTNYHNQAQKYETDENGNIKTELAVVGKYKDRKFDPFSTHGMEVFKYGQVPVRNPEIKAWKPAEAMAENQNAEIINHMDALEKRMSSEAIQKSVQKAVKEALTDTSNIKTKESETSESMRNNNKK